MKRSPTALADRDVLVMGLGCFGGGLGATEFLLSEGARVRITDLRSETELREGVRALEGRSIEWRLGEHRREDFERADVVVASPAVAPDHELLVAAREAGARVVSEVELFLERCPARIAAVTGTQGKSSTASMLAQSLELAGTRVHLGGNIGGSLLSTLPEMEPTDAVVLELSSYQLEALSADLVSDGPGVVDVAVVTNVLADHLERHGTREAYARAKLRLLQILRGDGTALVAASVCDEWKATPSRGRLVRVGAGEELALRGGEFRFGEENLGSVRDLTLPGAFQAENALVALAAARLLGAAPVDLRAAVPELTGLAHRLEDLGRIGGRRVWDNGVSTTPDSTAAALRSLDAPCVLLCGGLHKASLPLDVLVEAARERAARVVTFGRSAEHLARCLASAGVPARATATLEEAVEAAWSGEPREADLLFSPACASFDAYRNFQERADEFRALLDARRIEAVATAGGTRSS